MFAFLEVYQPEKVNFIQRFYRLFRKDYGVEISVKNFCNMPYLHVRVQDVRNKTETGEIPAAMKRRILTLVEILRRYRIKEVCFAENFPYLFRGPIQNGHFAEVGTESLYEAVSGEVAERFSGDGEKTAVLFAGRMTPSCKKILFAISTKFRFLLLCAEEDYMQVCRELLERYGISVLFQPPKKRISEAEFALFFAPPAGNVVLSPNCVVFSKSPALLQNVIGGKRVLLESVLVAPEKREELPENAPEMPFISEAIQYGAVRAEEVHLGKTGDLEENEKQLALDNR